MRRVDMMWLGTLCACEMATMLVFLNYTAILPILQAEWGMRHGEAGLIFSAYQACYLLAVLVLASLTDRMDTRTIYLASAVWAGLAGLAFPFLAQGFRSAVVLRALAGIGLAGTYVPGMRLVAQRFGAARRGLAIACYASAFGLGSALSLVLTGYVTRLGGWRMAMGITALGPLVAAGLAAAILSPAPPPPIREKPRLLGARVFRNRPALWMIAGYSAHNWELFGMRAWLPPFLAAAFVRRGAGLVEASSLAATLASGILLVGAASNIAGGWVSDRWGRLRVIVLSQVLSAACSLAIGWLLASQLWTILLVAAAYGIFVTSESGTLSTGVTELAEPSALGATLAVQSCLGFLAAALAPAAFGFVLDRLQPAAGGAAASPWQWGPAFGVLALGVLMGPLSMLALRRAQKADLSRQDARGQLRP